MPIATEGVRRDLDRLSPHRNISGNARRLLLRGIAPIQIRIECMPVKFDYYNIFDLSSARRAP